MAEKREGWTWLMNSPKWHYFREGRSLCGKWMILSHGGLQDDGGDGPDACSTCRRKRLREKKEIDHV